MLLCRGLFTMARASAFTVAAIPSMRDELFDRSGLVNIKLSLFSFVARQLAFGNLLSGRFRFSASQIRLLLCRFFVLIRDPVANV
jgi:hypothetical protein